MAAEHKESRLHVPNGRYPCLVAAEAAGQGLVEYALILILVVLVCFVLLTVIGPWVGGVFSDVVAQI